MPPSEPVYPEREDTWLLVPFARASTPGSRVLDIGTGSGRLALEAAHAGARVVATDRNPFALRRLRKVARMEGLPIEPVRTDLARGLGRFDRILANPPYLPTRPGEEDPDPWHSLAIDGGPDGCRVVDRLVDELPAHLSAGGRAFCLISSLQAPASTERVRARWLSQGGSVNVRAERVLEGERLEVWELAIDRDAQLPP